MPIIQRPGKPAVLLPVERRKMKFPKTIPPKKVKKILDRYAVELILF